MCETWEWACSGNFEFLAGSSLDFLGMMKPDESISSLPRKWDELGIDFWSLVAAGTGDTGDTTKLMRYWSSILGWSRLEQ